MLTRLPLLLLSATLLCASCASQPVPVPVQAICPVPLPPPPEILKSVLIRQPTLPLWRGIENDLQQSWAELAKSLEAATKPK